MFDGTLAPPGVLPCSTSTTPVPKQERGRRQAEVERHGHEAVDLRLVITGTAGARYNDGVTRNTVDTISGSTAIEEGRGGHTQPRRRRGGRKGRGDVNVMEGNKTEGR